VHSPVADTSTLVDSASQQQQQKQNPTKNTNTQQKKQTISHWNLLQGWTVFLQQQQK
jgi:hypothetical protein